VGKNLGFLAASMSGDPDVCTVGSVFSLRVSFITRSLDVRFDGEHREI